MQKELTIAQRILDEITSRGGMTGNEIVRFIVEDIRGGKYHPSFHRGVWGTNLYLTYSRKGILQNFCQRNEGDKKWRVTEPYSAPFFRTQATPSFYINRANAIARYKRYLDSLPKCTNLSCTRKVINKNGVMTPAGTHVCTTQLYNNIAYDCAGMSHKFKWNWE
tara:strand:- start:109 stop:600 length:492 start_codon:yes stop_codon:yes gene_type:complete